MSGDHSFELRILKASWGIAIDLVARVTVMGTPPAGGLPAASRTWLVVTAKLPAVDITHLLSGLRSVAPSIERVEQTGQIVVEVVKVDYVPTDYQPEAMAAAIIGWAGEVFGLDEAVDVSYDPVARKYKFVF